MVFSPEMMPPQSISIISGMRWARLEFVEICGWALARAHARTGDPAKIAGYLGKNEAFDCAIADFAVALDPGAGREDRVAAQQSSS